MAIGYSHDGDTTDESESSFSSPAPTRCQHRRTKLRPVFPRFDWMIIPNTLAYAMSWYGLFVGKFPVQVLSTVFGLAIIFSAGIHRIQIADIRPEDYLPTDSRSTIERTLTTMFDYNDPRDATENPTVIIPPATTTRRSSNRPRPNRTARTTEATTTSTTKLISPTTLTQQVQRRTTTLIDGLVTSKEEEEDYLEDDTPPEKPPVFKRLTTSKPSTTKPPFKNKRPAKKTASTSTTAATTKNTTTKSKFYTVPEFPFPLHERKKRDTYLDPHGHYQSCRINSVLIVAKRNVTDKAGRSYNLFNREMLNEIERLEETIFSMGVEVVSPKSGDGGFFFYEDRDGAENGVCTKQPTGECGGFNLRVMRALFPTDSIRDPLGLVFSSLPGVGLTYPHYMSYDLSQFFGRVETAGNKHNGLVKHIGAVREVYCVNEFHVDWFKRAFSVHLAWEKAFDKTLRKFKSKYFDVFWIAEYQKQAEQDFLIKNMLPKVGVTFLALMLWCTVGAMMNDAVRSKPWAGVTGVCATLIGCVSGVGICLWITPRFWPIIMAVPLLTLAIGLDDMFILLEAWSHTNPALPVEERIMLSMNVGGTSIVITFCINLLDFVIGNYTPYPLIQALSTYAIATMVLDFFFQMTIFCSVLSLLGTAEAKNRHSCCCCLAALPTRGQVLKKAGIAAGNAYTLLCCAGGLPREQNTEKIRKLAKDEDEIEAGQFHQQISEFISNLLTRLPFRICAIFGFFIYLALSIWSITQMEVGLKAERIYRRSSNLYDYTYYHRNLFTAYSNEIVVVVHNPVDYSRPEIQRKFMDFFDKVKESGYFWGEEETKCWIGDFLKWAKRENIDMSTMTNNRDVIDHLRRHPDGFLASVDPTTYTSYGHHARDIRISVNGSVIRKSRFRLRAKNITGPARQIGMMTSIRELVDRYRPDIHMFTYTGDFQLYDQYLTAVPATLYYCGMTLGCSIVVALFMIPHPACLFWVAVFVTSVLIGIIGQMRLWDMDLDSVSLINLLIAISFCSDLIAHPVYIFLITPVPKTSKDGKPIFGPEARLLKARALIEEVAAAAVPACVGTTLSVIAMSTSDAYIFIAFFRIMFLSVLLSVFHALVFVPAFLSFIGPSNSGLQSGSRHAKEDLAEAESSPPTGEIDDDYDVLSSVVTEPVSMRARSNANLIAAFEVANNDEPIIFKKAPEPPPPPAGLTRRRTSGQTQHRHTQTDRNVLMGFLPHRPAPSCHAGAGLRMFYGARRIWDARIERNGGRENATTQNQQKQSSSSNNNKHHRQQSAEEEFSDAEYYYLPETIRPVPIVSSKRHLDKTSSSHHRHHSGSNNRHDHRHHHQEDSKNNNHHNNTRSSSHQNLQEQQQKPHLIRTSHRRHSNSVSMLPLDDDVTRRPRDNFIEGGFSNTMTSSHTLNQSFHSSGSHALNRSRTGVEMLPAKNRFNV